MSSTLTVLLNDNNAGVLSGDVRGGRHRPSLSEFADQLDSVIRENHDLASQLNQATREKATLCQLYEQSRTEYESERDRLNAEIETLRSQINGRVQHLLSTKERLMREEYERKFQDMMVSVRQERHKYTTHVEKLKTELSSCICQTVRLRAR
jgi:chromosome segregation ATPase